MRELTNHKVNGLNEAIKIEVIDEPGSGNACHVYEITGFEKTLDVPDKNNPSTVNRRRITCLPIVFQNGPLRECDLANGIAANGISNEALLAIVEDRLIGFQSGEFSCRENAIALTKIQEAMLWLQKRTRDRMARGVEGTSTK